MATMANPTPDAIITLVPAAETMLRDMYARYQFAVGEANQSNQSKREAGLALGKALYDLRAQAEVVSGGTTFDRTLKTLGIPRRTAYRWIGRYELFVSIRRPKSTAVMRNPVHPRSARAARNLMSRVIAAMRGSLGALRGADLYAAAHGCLMDDGHHEADGLSRMISALEEAKRGIDAVLTIFRQVQRNAGTEAVTPDEVDEITTAVAN